MRGRIKQHKSTILVINFLIDTPCVNLVYCLIFVACFRVGVVSERESEREDGREYYIFSFLYPIIKFALGMLVSYYLHL